MENTESTVRLDEGTRRILIAGEIDENTSTDILQYFLELEKSDGAINIVFLASPGGSWDHGLGLLQLFLNSENYINTFLLGPNSSTSAMLYLAGDSRYISPRSSLMFHYGSLELDDTYKEVINYTELAKKELEEDHLYLSERSNKPPAYWKEMLNKGNVYIDTDRSLELGLAHEIKLPSEKS